MNEKIRRPDQSAGNDCDLSHLDELQVHVTQNQGTEAPFTGKYLYNKEKGEYQCVVCNNALFSSDTKYESGSGWPSFWVPLAGDRVRMIFDDSHGMRRVEVRCGDCDAHLGHVFDDGPHPGGQRFCINSAALGFKPEKK